MNHFSRRLLALLMALIILLGTVPASAMALDQNNYSRSNTTATSHNKNGWETTTDGKCYYVNGEKASGWQKIDGTYHYFDPSSHVMQTGWLELNGHWYYLRLSDGKPYAGWQTIDGVTYHFASDGKMDTGWLSYNNKWYYLGNNGDLHTEWNEIDGDWYYFYPKYGAMLTGWITVDGTKYYLASSGKMVTGTTTINGVKYRFNSDGSYAGRVTSSSSGSKSGSSSGSSTTNSYTVYVSKSGGKIHTRSNCSGMKYYYTMTYAQAIAAGYVKCKKCY